MKQIRIAMIFQNKDYSVWFSPDGQLPVRVCLNGSKCVEYKESDFFAQVKDDLEYRIPGLMDVPDVQWYCAFLGETPETFGSRILESAERAQVKLIPEEEIARELTNRRIPLAVTRENAAKAVFHITRWNSGPPADRILFVTDAGKPEHPVYKYEMGESRMWEGPQILWDIYLPDEKCLCASGDPSRDLSRIENQIYENRPWYWETDPAGRSHYEHTWYLGSPDLDNLDLGSPGAHVVDTGTAAVRYHKKAEGSWETGALFLMLYEDGVEALFCRDKNSEPVTEYCPGGLGLLDRAILHNTLYLRRDLPPETENAEELLAAVRKKAEQDPVFRRRLLRECRALRREFVRKKMECPDFAETEPVMRRVPAEVTGTGELILYLSETIWDEILTMPVPEAPSWHSTWRTFLQRLAAQTGPYRDTTGAPLYLKGHWLDCALAEEEVCRIFQRAMVQKDKSAAGTVSAVADHAMEQEYRRMFEERFELIRGLRCRQGEGITATVEDHISCFCREIYTEMAEKTAAYIGGKTEAILVQALLETEKPAWNAAARLKRLKKTMTRELKAWIAVPWEKQSAESGSLRAEVLRLGREGQDRMLQLLEPLYGELFADREGGTECAMQFDNKSLGLLLYDLIREKCCQEPVIWQYCGSRVEEAVIPGWENFCYTDICRENPDAPELPGKEHWTDWKMGLNQAVSKRVWWAVADYETMEAAVERLTREVSAFLEKRKKEMLEMIERRQYV